MRNCDRLVVFGQSSLRFTELDIHRNQQALALDTFPAVAGLQLFVGDALVGRVLIDQEKAPRAFEQDQGTLVLAEDLETSRLSARS